MILVTEEDYDYSETIGLFDTIDKALDHLRDKNMKPQYYTFVDVMGTDIKPVHVLRWCHTKGCIIDQGLKKVAYNDWHCKVHYANALKHHNDAKMEMYRVGEENARQLRIQDDERIKFEKKWDIRGLWYATFIYDKGTDEEIQKQVDKWKSGNMVSGSSMAIGLNFNDMSMTQRGHDQ